MKYGALMRNQIFSSPLIATTVVFAALAVFAVPEANAEPEKGAVRVLFLGHESEHHNSNQFYPMLAFQTDMTRVATQCLWRRSWPKLRRLQGLGQQSRSPASRHP